MSIDLPSPLGSNSMALEKVIESRRSCRDFAEAPLKLSDLSLLLWAAQGITDTQGQRSVPSAGAQYPSQIYVVAGNLSGITSGVYLHHAKGHSLDLHLEEDVQKSIYEAAIDNQPWVGQAAVVMVITANIPSMLEHFYEQPPMGARGRNYVNLETGAIAQHILLQAECIGLGAVLVGGFDDRSVQQALHLPETIQPTAMVCVGAKQIVNA